MIDGDDLRIERFPERLIKPVTLRAQRAIVAVAIILEYVSAYNTADAFSTEENGLQTITKVNSVSIHLLLCDE